MDIGIDLGTTFSVIAVKGNVALRPDYEGGEGRYLPECDVTIIPSRLGELTFPSVFWVDPEDEDHILVGADAKSKAELGESPIMFSKRAIGTDIKLQMNDRTYSAKEVATHLLRYMKECAEEALGAKVNRAIVTHPAYFMRNQVEETREAAAAAGFDMSFSEQMLMEPVAAALAYLSADDRESIRVLTYDLGGGTFDVTVLERTEGVTKMRGYDGDHLLGGYNFDVALYEWILDRQAKSGRKIPYDADNPEDRGRRGQLLVLVEGIKIKLAEQRSPKVPVEVRVPNLLVDDQGRRVQVSERISRAEFADLIKSDIEKTIQCCHGALAKAEMTADELDAILLVGGSTYGPWIRDAVEAEFGKEANPYEPDLCVAAGAAIQAAMLPVTEESEGLQMVLDVPSTSALLTIDVIGTLRPTGGGALELDKLHALRVSLTTPQGRNHNLTPGDDGKFLFGDLALAEDEVNSFRLKVTDLKGTEILSRTVSVEHKSEGARVVVPTSVLPKPVYIRTVGGALKPVGEEGQALPVKCEVTVKTIFGDSTADIAVVQDDMQVGSIHVDGIPPDLGPGSSIVITAEITVENEMRGHAEVRSRSGSVVNRCQIKVTFPPMVVPDLMELREEYTRLEAEREQLAHLSDDPEQRLELGGRGRKLARQIAGKLGQQAPDTQEVHRLLRQFESLVNPPPDDMDPPRAEFRRMYEACEETLASAGASPEVAGMRGLLVRVHAEAESALQTKNQRKWTAANESLMKLRGRIERVVAGPEAPQPHRTAPPTWQIKDHFAQEVDGIRALLKSARESAIRRTDYVAKWKSRADELDRTLDTMTSAIEKVSDDTESSQAQAQCQLAVRALDQLRVRIRSVADGDDTMG